MVKRLTTKSIRYAMEQIKKGRKDTDVAIEIGVSPRHVRRLWVRFCTTGTPHIPQRPGRQLSPAEIHLVLDAHKQKPVGCITYYDTPTG